MKKVKVVYLCNPDSNKDCTKEGCFLNKGPCHSTLNRDCAVFADGYPIVDVDISIRDWLSAGYDSYEIRMSKGNRHVSRIIGLELLLTNDSEDAYMTLLTQMCDELKEN